MERELLLATVATNVDSRTNLLDVIASSNAAIVDVDTGHVTIMLAATPAAIDALERELEKYGTVELHRTGRVALPRLGR